MSDREGARRAQGEAPKAASGGARPETTGARLLGLAVTPAGVSTLLALAAGAAGYAAYGRATGILAAGLGFFVAWVLSNILLGLPPPEAPPRRRS